MEIETRRAYRFTQIKVDEIETMIFDTEKAEAEKMIKNLLIVAYDLCDYTGKSIREHMEDIGL